MAEYIVKFDDAEIVRLSKEMGYSSPKQLIEAAVKWLVECREEMVTPEQRSISEHMEIEYMGGYQAGYREGYSVGLGEGKVAGLDSGYIKGLSEGFSQGHDKGYDKGYQEGYDEGYSAGYSEMYWETADS
jgi:flagellar biosynthesis/type III secretory pathway protein FliH